MLTAIGNLTVYISSPAGSFTSNFGYVPVAAALIYGFGLFFPIIFTFLLRINGSEMNYANTICIYGYSMVSFIPAIVLCVIPSPAPFVALAAGCAFSTLFLLRNFAHELNK